MAKSFCAGCKYWQKIEGCKEMHEYFYACMKFLDAYNLKTRKKLCNGKYKEEEV